MLEFMILPLIRFLIRGFFDRLSVTFKGNTFYRNIAALVLVPFYVVYSAQDTPMSSKESGLS